MPRKLLSSIVLVLLITNILTLLFWNKDKPKEVIIDNEDNTVNEIDTKKPVATVDGKDITYDEWSKSLRKDYGKKQLKKMIDKSVVEKLVEKEEIEVNEKVIDREIALLRMTQGVMTKDEIEKKEAEWKEDIIYRYQLEYLLTKDVSIPEEDIKSFYNSYHNQYDFKAATQVSHILVPDMETAEKVKKELDDGASFSLLAKEYSIDEDSRDQGGYMGFFVNTSQFLPDAYLEETRQMEEHTYSGPIQSEGGYAIIYLHSKLPEITFTYDEIKPYVKGELALDDANKDLNAGELWDQIDVDWIYDEKDTVK
ncbi:MAG TPA: peptidyl-prolyl cis-trans isomerase [Bacillota bacterium]|nr:peptidyl-prolyl cis-trans isomerase [Bacillota bacterium]